MDNKDKKEEIKKSTEGKPEKKIDKKPAQEINYSPYFQAGDTIPSEEILDEDVSSEAGKFSAYAKPFDEYDPGSSTNYSNPLYKDARTCAVKLIVRFERSDSWLDKLIDSEIRSNKKLNDFDKSLLNELVHGVVRWVRRLDWFLNGFYRGNYEKCVPELKNAMRVALYQILFLNKIPYSAAVNEAVEYIKRLHGDKHAGVVNGLLRTIIRTLDSLVWPTRDIDEVNYLGIIQSHPNWLVRRWIQRYGFDDAQKLCESNNKRPPITLRRNKLKISDQDFISYLSQKGIIFARTNYLGEYYNAKIFSRIYDDEYFKQGYFSVQDESMGLISHLLNPKSGEIILDACAAPGGKSAHIAEISDEQCKIVAVEKYLSRAENMKRNFDRMGYTNITSIHDNISEPETEVLKTKLIGKVDKVLIDAPCSGFGVLTKKPEIKWKREPADIHKLQKLQLEILDSAVKYVKQNGVILYSTCTIEPEENSEVINIFLEKNPEFEVENAKNYLPEKLVTKEGFLEIIPFKHGIDGAFAARLKKVK